MILCVTLNPCLDKTLDVPSWSPGDSVRGRDVSGVVGGKGNNVARALTRLGRHAQPLTFLGGEVGILCRRLLVEQDRFDPIIVLTPAPTRIILTVRDRDGRVPSTAFFDPNPEIRPEEAAQLLNEAERALQSGDVEALTLSGSSPGPSCHDLYADLIALANRFRVPSLLDSYGPALASVLDDSRAARPTVLQLNRDEAAGHLGQTAPDDEAIGALLRSWFDSGIRLALVTDGSRPALAIADGQAYRFEPPAIQAVNPVGSGDSTLAGLTDAWLDRRDPPEILRCGFACGIANALVWEPAAIDPVQVERLEGTISISTL